ncbi:MAG TPA: hypothetical protein VEU11_10075, partial [Terriglobales bacterium]|nr:hypothetical protein [Terriglobales bacterium]
MRPGENRRSTGLRRRNFLIRSWQGLSAALLRGLPFSFVLQSRKARAAEHGFHLHPHYRSETPLDAMLLKTKAGSDDFITEKHHDQIAAILAGWS